jgi:hypothetical protein
MRLGLLRFEQNTEEAGGIETHSFSFIIAAALSPVVFLSFLSYFSNKREKQKAAPKKRASGRYATVFRQKSLR